MITITAVFSTAEAARNAIGDLHVAGFGRDDIAFLVNQAHSASRTPSSAGESTGRRVGDLAADIGSTTLNMVPFVGRNLAEGPMGKAVRRALQNTGATAGILVDALSEGGWSDTQTHTARDRGRALVTIQTDDARSAEAMAVLARSGALSVESIPVDSRSTTRSVPIN